MCKHSVRLSIRLAIVACTVLSFVPFISASVIVPGQTAYAAAELDPVGGFVVQTTGPVPFFSATFSGTLTSSVISGDTSNPFGGLTFTYLLQSDPGSPNAIGRLTVNDFAGFLTDMSFQTPPAGLQPTLNDRSNGVGDVIGFSFIGAPIGPGVLRPGASSALLVVQTDAPAWRQTNASVIDGSVASVPSLAPIPEPASLALLLLGAGTLLIKRRRSR